MVTKAVVLRLLRDYIIMVGYKRGRYYVQHNLIGMLTAYIVIYSVT